MHKATRWMILVGAVACACGAADENRSTPPKPGELPSAPKQVAQMNAARRELAAALEKQAPEAIAAAEQKFRDALGPFAGVPEAAEEHSPKGAKAPRPTAADYQKLTRGMSTFASGSDHAKNNRMELRHAAYLAIGLLALAEAKPPEEAAYRKQATVELDYLISKQASEGYFPYPADPIAPPHLQKVAEVARTKYPEKVKNGFIYLDADGSQFDTGCCAYALGYGYQLLKEERFLKAARKAGDWALAKPLTVNWNYNSFSVWQLAKLYEITKEDKYLKGAVRIAKLGVLPGQMPNGRWSDQHNAKAVYHWIMVRGLVALLRVLPEEHPDLKEIRAKTQLAIEARVEETLREGGGNQVHALVALTEALDYFGPSDRWTDALQQTGGLSPYSAGVWARSQSRK